MLFPVPGAPVTPTQYACPVCGKSSRSKLSVWRERFSISVIAREIARTSPARTCSAHRSIAGVVGGVAGGTDADGIAGALTFSQKLPRDHQALNLAGTLADGAELYVAIIFFRGIILHEAVTAEDLHGFAGDAHGHLRRE